MTDAKPARSLLFRLAALLVAVVALFTLTPPVWALSSGCRADPIIYFTDGTRLTLITELDIDAEQIKKLEYTVTTPRGKVVDHIVYDVGALGVKEKVTVTAGASSTTYTIDQYAKTHVPAQVTAINTLNATTRVLSGRNDQHLVVTITP